MPLGQRHRRVLRERGSLPWVFHLFSWSLVGLAARVYHRLKIEGRENLPKDESFVMVSNHCSHLDTLVLGCALPWRQRPDSFPIAAGDVFFRTRGIALMSALFVNALPMWRKSIVTHTLAELRQRLAARRCVFIVFPEGTRTRDGRMADFRSGLGMIVAGTPTPVVPCRVWGTFQALPPDAHFPRPSALKVRIGQPLRFDAVANERAGWDEIAKRTQEAVRDLGPQNP